MWPSATRHEPAEQLKIQARLPHWTELPQSHRDEAHNDLKKLLQLPPDERKRTKKDCRAKLTLRPPSRPLAPTPVARRRQVRPPQPPRPQHHPKPYAARPARPSPAEAAKPLRISRFDSPDSVMTHSRLPANCAGFGSLLYEALLLAALLLAAAALFQPLFCLAGPSSLAACASPALSVGRAVFTPDWSWRRGGQTAAMKTLENPPGPRRRPSAGPPQRRPALCRAGQPC